MNNNGSRSSTKRPRSTNATTSHTSTLFHCHTLWIVSVTATMTWLIASHVQTAFQPSPSSLSSSSSSSSLSRSVSPLKRLDHHPLDDFRWFRDKSSSSSSHKPKNDDGSSVRGKSNGPMTENAKSTMTNSKPLLDNNDKKKKQESTITTSRTPGFDYSNYTGPSRVFPKFEHEFPCFKGEPLLMRTTPAHEGILFHRPMKVGSTSMAGIVLRLVHNRGQDSKYGYDKCLHRCMHGTAKAMDYYHRNKSASILFSLLRHPQARAISQVFHFDITAGRHEPTDDYLISRLLQSYNHLHYFDDLGARNYTEKGQVPDNYRPLVALAQRHGFANVNELIPLINPPKSQLQQLQKQKEPQEIINDDFYQRMIYTRDLKVLRKYGPNFTSHSVIQDILQDYDFIAIMERMDESLVIMQMLFNFTTKEILYTRAARSSGSFSNGYKDRPCFYILPSFITPGVQAFLESDVWQSHIAPDMELYHAASKSMDRTIDALGRDEFQARLLYFRQSLQIAQNHCRGRVRTMCSDAGAVIKPVNTTCYVFGEGCDHDCIDELDIPDYNPEMNGGQSNRRRKQ